MVVFVAYLAKFLLDFPAETDSCITLFAPFQAFHYIFFELNYVQDIVISQKLNSVTPKFAFYKSRTVPYRLVFFKRHNLQRIELLVQQFRVSTEIYNLKEYDS